MKFVIIGTGNVATFLALKLTKAGHTCTGIYGRNKDHVDTLANRIHCAGNTLENIDLANADVCIISVTDDAINDIIQQINSTTAVIVHTSGAVDISILSKFTQGYGVIWPVYSIVKNNLPEEKNIPIAWESSNNESRNIINELVADLSTNSIEVDSEKRKWLHLTAVFSNNFSNHLFAIAEQVCKEHDLPFSILLPIIHQSVSRLYETGAYQSQTGPARRNDLRIMKEHIGMLNDHTEWQELYEKISASIIKMYNKE